MRRGKQCYCGQDTNADGVQPHALPNAQCFTLGYCALCGGAEAAAVFTVLGASLHLPRPPPNPPAPPPPPAPPASPPPSPSPPPPQAASPSQQPATAAEQPAPLVHTGPSNLETGGGSRDFGDAFQTWSIRLLVLLTALVSINILCFCCQCVYLAWNREINPLLLWSKSAD